MRLIQKTSRTFLPVVIGAVGLMGAAGVVSTELTMNQQPSSSVTAKQLSKVNSSSTTQNLSTTQTTAGNSQQNSNQQNNRQQDNNHSDKFSLSRLIVAAVVSFLAFLVVLIFAVRTPKGDKKRQWQD